MELKNGKAILVVSFGTVHAETCSKTIDVIEDEIRGKYVHYPVYRAWTNSMVRSKVEERDGVHIFNVAEAFEQMHKDGIKYVFVQPTHVLSGLENISMKNDIARVREQFTDIKIGTPLLTTGEDIRKVTNVITKAWTLDDDEILVYMGHGTEYSSNSVYAEINEELISNGQTRIIIGTMSARPTITDIITTIKKTKIQKIILAPFMIVAGSHAINNLAGEQEDSWKSIFEKEGYEVRCVLKGLGEYEGIRQIFIEHLEEAMNH